MRQDFWCVKNVLDDFRIVRLSHGRAQEEGFVVVGQIEGRTWSKETAEEFYVEHRGKAFYDDLVAFMSSGPVVQLCLEKVKKIPPEVTQRGHALLLVAATGSLKLLLVPTKKNVAVTGYGTSAAANLFG